MSEPIIRVENLGKKYLIRHQSEGPRYTALRDVLADAVRGVRSRFRGSNNHNRAATQEEFWALKDVSFEVQRGEVVGIIGRNGAGKSTLLKILSRITEPTTGRVEMNGRVASLLEVGTGFHSELTGRENVFLNGAILGMLAEEISRKFDEIVAFAEVEKFLDTPVKRYSSGMYMRLAFAVAAHLEPEILIVDEVLAVGDSEFQKKCMGKMGEVANGGRTVLFVSHNAVAVRNMCNTVVWLDGGRIVDRGDANRILDRYASSGISSLLQGSIRFSSDRAPGNDVVRLRAVVLTVDGKETCRVPLDRPLDIAVDYECLKDSAAISVSLHLFDEQSICVLATGNSSTASNIGVHRANCRIPAHFLNDINYSLKVILVENIVNFYFCNNAIVSFEAVDPGTARGGYFGKIIGVVRPLLAWNVEPIEAS